MSTPFTCLAIETATAVSTVAVCRGDEQHEVRLSGNRPGAGEVYSSIDQALTAVGVDKSQLNCIAFGCGPGSFTGVRIAAAVTQGLAFGLEIPVARVSTLALLAAPLCQDYPDSVIAAGIDARQNEAYLGFYKAGENTLPEQILADALVPSAGIAVDFDSLVLAGNAWSEYPELNSRFAGEIVAVKPDALPSATSLLAVAEEQWNTGVLVDAFAAQPNYLRDKVWD